MHRASQIFRRRFATQGAQYGQKGREAADKYAKTLQKLPSAMPKEAGQVGTVVGAVVGAVVLYNFLPWAYHMDMVPFVMSPAYYEKVKNVRFDNYDRGFIYMSYDDGNPVYDMPECLKGKMYLKQH